MSTPLSREQVELLKPLATYDAQTVRFDSSQGGYVGVYTALAMMIATDAALRQQLATARQGVWEEAAIYWDTMAEGPCKDSDDFGWACRVAQWCREQAKRETLP